MEEAISEEAFIVSLTTESPSAQCENFEPSNEQLKGGIKSILDLDGKLKIKLLSKLDRQLWMRS